jgi:hypothetical protein
MTARLAVAFVLLFCVGGFGLAAAINGFAIIDAVNTKLPPDERFAELGWYLPKTLRLHAAYRRLYPDGTLLRRQALLAAFALVCLVLAATLLGFGFPGIAWLGGLGLLSLWFVYIRKPRT